MLSQALQYVGALRHKAGGGAEPESKGSGKKCVRRAAPNACPDILAVREARK